MFSTVKEKKKKNLLKKKKNLFWDFFPPNRTSSLRREKFGSWLVKPNIIYEEVSEDREYEHVGIEKLFSEVFK